MKRSQVQNTSEMNNTENGIAAKPESLKSELLLQKLVVYNDTSPDVYESINLDEILSKMNPQKVNWIHFNSYKSSESLEMLGRHFNFHSLLLEDISFTDLLPKVEYYQDHMLFTLKILQVDKHKEIGYEQVSIILGVNYLVSIQENPGSFFNQAKERSLNQKAKINKNGADFLFYVLVDLIVDNYFSVIEYLREQIDIIEDMLIEYPNQNFIHDLHDTRKKIVVVRKYVFSLLESIQNIISDEPSQISKSNLKYIKDIKDHVQYNFQLVETFKENQRALLELNQSNQSNNMTQVMKTLTIITSIFIPLTFIVGVYGMNFHYMPEIAWKWGYFTVMFFMLTIATSMIIYMKRKRWF